ncbi:3786_t:CDS:2, partial [Gigaspora margarita]
TSKKVLLLVDKTAFHITSDTNNIAEVQDDSEELSSETHKEGPEKGPEKDPKEATKIIPETSKPKESKLDNELQNETTNDNNDIALLLEDLSAKTNLVVQELSNNIKEESYKVPKESQY